MKQTEIKEGMTVFYYHPGAVYPKDQIVECKVVREKNELRVKHVKPEHWIKFYVSQIDVRTEEYIFETAEEVQQIIDSKFEAWKKGHMECNKQEYANLIFRDMLGEFIYERRYIEVMRDKIEMELGIRPEY